MGLKPTTSCLEGRDSIIELHLHNFGGDDRLRTDDLLLAKQTLSQLSYTPVILEPAAEIESATFTLQVCCSAY